MQNSETRLNKDEWIVVLSLLGLLATLTFATHKHWFTDTPRQYSDSHVVYNSSICVKVEGEVEHPGFYTMKKGDRIEDVLSLAKPKKTADLKKVAFAKKIQDGQTLRVPPLEWITIYLEGAVEKPGPLLLPKGATIEEVLKHAKFKPQADLNKLRKKKKLKDGEIVKVLFDKSCCHVSEKGKLTTAE